MKHSQIHSWNSVKSGYNTLFRYNPTAKQQMQVDSYDPTMPYDEYVESENRFAILSKVNKTNKAKLIKQSEKDAISRRETYLNKQKESKKD